MNYNIFIFDKSEITSLRINTKTNEINTTRRVVSSTSLLLLFFFKITRVNLTCLTNLCVDRVNRKQYLFHYTDNKNFGAAFQSDTKK